MRKHAEISRCSFDVGYGGKRNNEARQNKILSGVRANKPPC
jgi:hypothetical protein